MEKSSGLGRPFVGLVVLLTVACGGNGGSSPTSPSPGPSVTTGTITGRVSNSANNSAIAGATVSTGGRSTTTDGGGNYRLDNITFGSISLRATASGFAEST